MRLAYLVCLLAIAALLCQPAGAADASEKRKKRKAQVTSAAASETNARKSARRPAQRNPVATLANAGEAEARLIAVYRLIGQANNREALAQAEALVRDHPNFQLAQLLLGDLLSARTRLVRTVGDVPDTTALAAAPALADLREEARQRIKALREQPPAGLLPSQFVALSARNRHAIAIDASRSRLYLFENAANGPRLVANYYISLGKSGIEKAAEGDLRTPLGVYFITSNLDPRTLKDFYGAGALPINYPNPYDNRRGKTGSGIWLHGTPPGQFARAPKATDGCIVLANADLQQIINTVQVRTTPVVIAPTLDWVPPPNLRAQSRDFEATLDAWRKAKGSGDLARTMDFYSPDFATNGKSRADWSQTLQRELERKRELVLKDLSLLHYNDGADTMVVTFGEVADGAQNGVTRRQYWLRSGTQWKIFFEGVIG